MEVKHIMVKKVITLSPTETIKDAVEKFAAHNISGCPVVNENEEVIGIFTETDLLASLKTHQREVRMLYPPYIPIGISFVETKKQKEILSVIKEMSGTKIEKVMRTNVIKVAPEEKIEHALQLIVENKINRLPVVKDNKIVGIVTRGDIIKGVYEETTS